MGLEFTVLTAEIDETKYETEDPEESVCRICREKARAVGAAIGRPHEAAALILTADTIVVLDGKIMGKPHDEAEARAMLRALSGREHAVYTAFTLLPVEMQSAKCRMQNEATGNRQQATEDGSTDCRDQSADWSRNDRRGQVIRLNCRSICFLVITVQMGLPWGQYFRSSRVRTVLARAWSSAGSVI